MIVENFKMLFDLLYLLCIPYYQLLAQLKSLVFFLILKLLFQEIYFRP